MLESCHQLHFKSSTFCLLCHKSLPEPQYESNYELPESKAWEYEVLGLCDIANSKDSPSVVTIPVDLADLGTFSDLPIIQSDQSLAIEFCLASECGSCKEGKVAYLVHRVCWRWIRQFNENCTALPIYELARSTHPIHELIDAVDGENSKAATDFPNSINKTQDDTGIGQGLRIFSRLPAEIRSMISALFVRNLSWYLFAGSETSSLLLSTIDRSRSDVIQLECNTLVETLYAKSISVWGSSYISSLSFNNAKGISVKRSAIKGIKFIVGPCGLRALGILYADDNDNSKSAWLGDPTNGWIGVIYGTDISRLWILKDNLKYLRIDIGSVDARSVPESQVMWDNKDVPFTQSHRILETISTRGQIQNFSEWRLCRYLPFLDGGHYISGLTMYCDGHSIMGMAAYGKSRKLVGSCKGCPIHFCLRPKERIVSLWLRMPVNHFNIESDPNILITTNYNRSCIFGPSLSSSTIQERQYAWTCLNKESGPDIIGIFYDVLSRRPLDKIANIGITQDINPGHSFVKQELPRIPMPRWRPRMLGNEVTGLYLSVGTLSLVQSLRVRKVGLRFTGVSISHHDGSIDVLGQWDDFQSSRNSEIYNSSDGVLTSITFRFCGESRASYVNGIFVGVGDVDAVRDWDTGTFKIFSIKKLISPAISWWFSELSDHVEPWIGDYQEVNVSTESYKIVDLR